MNEVTIPEEHNENYKAALKRAKDNANNVAEKSVPELYWILRNEEGKSPSDAREMVKQDLVDTFSRVTIDKWIPEEAKNTEKVRSGRIGGKKKADSASANASKTEPEKEKEGQTEEIPKILITTTGEQIPQGDEPKIETPKTEPEKENPLAIENQFLREENKELREAMKKIQQFTPAAQLQQPQEDDLNIVKVNAGIDAIWRLVQQELPKLKNRGWKTVEITMRAV